MVIKLFIALLTFNTFVFADALDDKIISFLDENSYKENRKYIDIIFKNRDLYFDKRDKVDDVKVIKKLKDNGLLRLVFDSPQKLKLTFITNANEAFFVKMIDETLNSLGYYRYIIRQSKKDEYGFKFSINIKTEYATDPELFQRELLKRGAFISDINRTAYDDWTYKINTENAYLNVDTIYNKDIKKYKRTLQNHWLNVKHVKKISITSSRSNNWYPYVAFYDKKMNLLKIYKRDIRTAKITLKLPKDCFYLKVSDKYTINNMKYGINISASGVR